MHIALSGTFQLLLQAHCIASKFDLTDLEAIRRTYCRAKLSPGWWAARGKMGKKYVSACSLGLHDWSHMSPAQVETSSAVRLKVTGAVNSKSQDKGKPRDRFPVSQAYKLPLCKRTTSVMSVLPGLMNEKYRLDCDPRVTLAREKMYFQCLNVARRPTCTL